MSADIIDFASRRPIHQDNDEVCTEDVWCCDCGTISFVFHLDGRIECCGCNAVQNSGDNGRWVIQQDDPHVVEAEVPASPGKEHDHLEF